MPVFADEAQIGPPFAWRVRAVTCTVMSATRELKIRVPDANRWGGERADCRDLAARPLTGCGKTPQALTPSGALDRPVQGGARNLAPSIFKAMRDSSSPSAPPHPLPLSRRSGRGGTEGGEGPNPTAAAVGHSMPPLAGLRNYHSDEPGSCFRAVCPRAGSIDWRSLCSHSC